MTGLEQWDTKLGLHVVRLHYTADPYKRTEEWYEEARRGMKDREWNKEYEISWEESSGLGVFSEDFVRDWHVAKQPLYADAQRRLVRGWDFGLTPACIWAQVDAMGRLNVLHELVTWDGRGDMKQMGIENFAQVAILDSNTIFPGAKWEDYADPAGWAKAQTDEKSCVDIMNQLGIYPSRGPVTFTLRRKAINDRLNSAIGGRASLFLDPSCRMLIEGFKGKYCFEQIGETGRFKDTIEKNAWSHPMDALSYIVGALYVPPKKDKDEDEQRKRTKRDPVTGY